MGISHAPRHVTYRAFAPPLRQPFPRFSANTRITVEGASGNDCKRRIRAICRAYRLPVRATLATMRRMRPRMMV